MISIRTSPNTDEKLSILSQDSRYDLACACGTKDPAEHRRRSAEGKWIYPVVLPDGRRTFLFKTLVSNACVNDCKYCPLRTDRDPQRCTLQAEELAGAFLDYYRARRVSGLFLSSAVTGSPDRTMERINAVASILRRRQFKGYIHLKIIPGAGKAAIDESLRLASAVSLNIETAGAAHFQKLSATKNYLEDIIRPIKLISERTARGGPLSHIGQTTQFVVGASDETDREIVKYMWGLYKRLHLKRVYFSAYQRGLGTADLPGEQTAASNADLLTREHRLYQVDWLIRKYGFDEAEVPFEMGGNLSLAADPKESWVARHPEFFPLDVNRADYYQLLRVPGLGPTTVSRIVKARREGVRFSSIQDFGKLGKRLKKAEAYLRFT